MFLDISIIMGSNQSASQKEVITGAQVSVEGVVKNHADDESTETTTKITERSRRSARKNMSGFERVQRKCRKKKREYDACYSEWYGGAFVSGKLEETRENCDDLFDAYKRCILMGMQKDREHRGVGAPKPDSALAMFAEEESEE